MFNPILCTFRMNERSWDRSWNPLGRWTWTNQWTICWSTPWLQLATHLPTAFLALLPSPSRRASMSSDRSLYLKIVLRVRFHSFFPFPWTFFHSSSWRIDAEPDDVIIRRGGFLQAVRRLSVSSICRMNLVIRSSAQGGRSKKGESLFSVWTDFRSSWFDFFPCRVYVKKLTTNWCRTRRCHDKESRIPASGEVTICFFDLQIGFCYSLVWTGESGRQAEAKKVRVSFCM